MLLSDFWLLATCCLPPLRCQLVLGIDWPVNPLIQVDSNHCLKKTCEHTANMCRIVSPVGMLCHLGAWGMASESGKHDNMAVSKLSKLFGLMHKTVVWGVQVDKPQTIACPHRKNYEGCCHILAGCCQLDVLKNDRARHGLGMDYIVQSKLPN